MLALACCCSAGAEVLQFASLTSRETQALDRSRTVLILPGAPADAAAVPVNAEAEKRHAAWLARRKDPAPTSAALDIQRLIRERLDAYAKGDAAGWARYVDEECLCGGSTRAGIQQAITARPAGFKNWYGEIGGFTASVHGDVAIVRYRVTEFSEIGGHRIELEQWRTETYLRRAGTWVLLGGADVVIPRDPVVAKVDPRLYDAYVGQYEYASGMRDIVTRDGDRLLIQATGQEKEELLPENDTTYFAKGQDWRMLFVRDPQGAVSSLIFRQNGQDLVAQRVQ